LLLVAVLALNHTDNSDGDGDPLDVLVLMDEPAFPGCKLICAINLVRRTSLEHTRIGSVRSSSFLQFEACNC
jgi:hypothetical protein